MTMYEKSGPSVVPSVRRSVHPSKKSELPLHSIKNFDKKLVFFSL
jgi:hypothetical protein